MPAHQSVCVMMQKIKGFLGSIEAAVLFSDCFLSHEYKSSILVITVLEGLFYKQYKSSWENEFVTFSMVI
jgi:hypothetical protein